MRKEAVAEAPTNVDILFLPEWQSQEGHKQGMP